MEIRKKPKQKSKWLCPVCGTNKNLDVVLMDVYESIDEKNGLVSTVQVHLDCINLTATKIAGELVFIQVVRKIESEPERAANCEIL